MDRHNALLFSPHLPMPPHEGTLPSSLGGTPTWRPFPNEIPKTMPRPEQGWETWQQGSTADLLDEADDEDDESLLVPWLSHQFEPANYPDPTTEESDDHRCDASSGAYANPGGSSSPAPHAVREPLAFPVSEKPAAAEAADDPYLRWGTTSWLGTFIDSWGGWGFQACRSETRLGRRR